MTLDPAAVRHHLDTAASALDTDAQGKAYEKLIVYLFESTPGCLAEPNVINAFGSEQVDVAVGNWQAPDGPALLPATFLVECKDWSKPVDSSTLGYFINTLANRSVEVGLMIAARGITGDPRDFSYAHSLLIQASARRIRVLVITTDEIAALACTCVERRSCCQRLSTGSPNRGATTISWPRSGSIRELFDIQASAYAHSPGQR